MNSAPDPAKRVDTRLVEIAGPRYGPDGTPSPKPDARSRLAEAEATLRAIGAGEVDAFVVSDGGTGRRVFTLTTADRPYRKFVENMRDGAATLSAGGLILYANPRLAEMLSCSIETVVGSPLAMFVARGVPLGLDALRGMDGLGVTVEFDLVDANGMVVPVQVGTSPLELDGELLTCLTFTDLTASKAQDREIARLSHAQAKRMADLQDAHVALTEQATHDSLTGLPNRALLMDRIEQALAHGQRSGRCLGLIFVDLDRFKQINDAQGHAAGDAVLRTAAERLVAVVRPMDTVARIGGDEFVVLAPDVDGHLNAVDLSTRLMASLCQRSDRSEDGDPVAASVGIAVSAAGSTAETLLNEADTAMYQAKTLGGGRAEVFDPALRLQIRQRTMAQQMLQSALDDRRIIVHYQPIVDLSTGIISRFEALARIVERDASVLAPAAFISVAEDTGLIVPLGAQVLGIACEEARRWQPAGATGSSLAVTVNLSSRQFEPGDLAAFVRERLDHSGLDPTCLHLELTETAVIDPRPEVLKQLEELRALGVQIGLDDFGTGYASLTHLRSLPLTFVKIDRTFVEGVGTENEDEGIVSAVIDLAANLGLRSIAEGVETKDQLDRLRELGCDEAQGYFFARPVPPEGLPELLEHPGW